MSRCVFVRVRTSAVALFSAATLFMGATRAEAQTTVVLDAPDSEVTDTAVRGGSYANRNFNGATLFTRASSNLQYRRRALLKFDTENRIPRGATIQSATLTLTIKDANAETRTLSAYRIAQSFQESQATWNDRKTSTDWLAAGGTLGGKYADARSGYQPGSKVSFDLKRLVQETVNGSYGSRYTRVAIVDNGSSTSSSYREFHASEAPDASVRPKLVVVYGGSPSSTSSSSSSGGSSPSGSSTSGSSSGTRLRVLHWNIHHGVGTDGRYDINRLASWIAKLNPDVVSLNEVEKYTSWGNEDQPARFAALLKSKTGRTWYYSFAQRYGNGSARGQGNLVLSRLPMTSKGYRALDCNRSAALASLVVNGRNITMASTHLDDASSSCRTREVSELKSWLSSHAEQRIVAGDWNAQASSSHVTTMTSSAYHDVWAKAKSEGKARTYPDNPNGATRRSRIDYIFYSRSASNLRLVSAEVFDTRNSSGHMPSDHKPLLAVYEVR